MQEGKKSPVLKPKEDSFLSRMGLGFFCSVEVVITASQNLHDIANLRENGTHICKNTQDWDFDYKLHIYQQINPVNIKVI